MATPQKAPATVVAVMVKEPVPHWHCTQRGASPKEYSNPDVAPVCEKKPGSMMSKYGYDWNTEDKTLPWVETHTIPASGVLRIDWPKGLLREPGCHITEGEREAVFTIEDEQPDHLTVRGKPGQQLTFSCAGVVART